MLVDDEKDYIQPLSERLESRGFDVSTVFSGEEALTLIENNNFDIVLLDIMMPEKSGLDTLQDILKIDFLVQVILLTGHAEIETAIGEVSSGVFDYLVKPVRIDQLIERIHLAYKRKKVRENQLCSNWQE